MNGRPVLHGANARIRIENIGTTPARLCCIPFGVVSGQAWREVAPCARVDAIRKEVSPEAAFFCDWRMYVSARPIIGYGLFL